jgi:serine/threonine protein phosphatase PrpC
MTEQFVLPTPERKELPPLEVALRSRPSSLHPDRNDDNGFTNAAKGVFSVFDGMGQGLAGDYASELAAAFLRLEVEETSASSVLATPYEVPCERRAVSDAMREMLKVMHYGMRASTMNPRYQELVRVRFEQLFLKDHPYAIGKIDEEPFCSQFQDALAEAVVQADHNHGSTAVIAKVWTDGKKRFITYAWIGDSRLYRWRQTANGNTLERLTVDDSVVNLAVMAGLIPDDSDTSIDTKISYAQVKQAFANGKLGLEGLAAMHTVFEREHQVTDPTVSFESLPPVSLINFSKSLLAALGIRTITEEDFKVHTLEIQDGDCFVALTDQITKFGGDQAVRDVLEITTTDSSEQIADAFQRKADQLANEMAYDDDSTVSVLKAG